MWSVLVNVSFVIVSFLRWFNFKAPVADLNAAQIDSDQLVASILESPQFRDYVSTKASERVTAEQSDYQRHLVSTSYNLFYLPWILWLNKLECFTLSERC